MTTPTPLVQQAEGSKVNVRASLAAGARCAARIMRPLLPLEARKRIVSFVDRYEIPGYVTFGTEILSDVGRDNPATLHKFIWSNHLASAAPYKVERQFEPARFDANRPVLFRELVTSLRAQGLDPATDVRSVFDVGCSLGYLLRYAETDLFPSANILRGIDIDKYAVEQGNAHLHSLGSKVRLAAGDIADLGAMMGTERYDVVWCCGVLMYLDEKAAEKVVADMLARADRLVGIICLAHPDIDNAKLEKSEIRSWDRAYIHNLRRMVERAGGKVVAYQWESRKSAKNWAHILVAEPPQVH